MTEEQIKTVGLIIAIITGISSMVFGHYNQKRISAEARKFDEEALKIKEETKKTVADTYYDLTERLGEDRQRLLENNKELEKKIDLNSKLVTQLRRSAGDHSKTIASLTKEQSKLKKESESCKLQHQIVELEMLQLKKHNNFMEWERDKIFVIDDDLDVLEEFDENFVKTSVLQYRGFHDHKVFLTSVQAERPPIVVVDHNLSGGQTADDIIAEFGYEPEIFVMSSSSAYGTKYKGGRIQFFVKEDFYVAKITAAVLKYLVKQTNTNRNT